MKSKLTQLIAGLIIYFIFGILMVLVARGGLSGSWGFIGVWTIGMAFAHAFVMEPFRQRLAKKGRQKK